MDLIILVDFLVQVSDGVETWNLKIRFQVRVEVSSQKSPVWRKTSINWLEVLSLGRRLVCKHIYMTRTVFWPARHTNKNSRGDEPTAISFNYFRMFLQKKKSQWPPDEKKVCRPKAREKDQRKKRKSERQDKNHKQKVNMHFPRTEFMRIRPPWKEIKESFSYILPCRSFIKWSTPFEYFFYFFGYPHLWQDWCLGPTLTCMVVNTRGNWCHDLRWLESKVCVLTIEPTPDSVYAIWIWQARSGRALFRRSFRSKTIIYIYYI